MKLITASVGNNGANQYPDVLLVQSLLHDKGYNPGPIDGICGKKTVDAILKFQATFLSNPDGRIDPGGTTWQKLTNNTTPSSAPSAPQWSGNSAQWPQDKKLASMHPTLRPKITALLQALASRGFQPKIVYGWRSVKVQLELYNQGKSKVKFSFHNAQLPDGTPNSYAADIIDARYNWDPPAETSGFWKALGEEAKKQGLYWGGDWVSFKDWAHVQLVSNDQLAKVKKESGL